MTVAPPNPEGLSVLDRPNSYIGKVVPRPNLERLMQGRGLYVSDMELPRMAHVVFLRSPHAHAKIIGIDAAAARRMPGVIAVVTGEELAAVITPWVGVLSHLKGLKSAPQHAIAIDRVCWQGEAVAAVVATSRAVAEDAAELVGVEYEELEAVTDMRTALDPQPRSFIPRSATISPSSAISMPARSMRRLPIPTRWWKRSSSSDGTPA